MPAPRIPRKPRTGPYQTPIRNVVREAHVLGRERAISKVRRLVVPKIKSRIKDRDAQIKNLQESQKRAAEELAQSNRDLVAKQQKLAEALAEAERLRREIGGAEQSGGEKAGKMSALRRKAMERLAGQIKKLRVQLQESQKAHAATMREYQELQAGLHEDLQRLQRLHSPESKALAEAEAEFAEKPAYKKIELAIYGAEGRAVPGKLANSIRRAFSLHNEGGKITPIRVNLSEYAPTNTIDTLVTGILEKRGETKQHIDELDNFTTRLDEMDKIIGQLRGHHEVSQIFRQNVDRSEPFKSHLEALKKLAH